MTSENEPTGEETTRWGFGEHVFTTKPIPLDPDALDRPFVAPHQAPPMTTFLEEVSRREKLLRAVRYHWWNTLLGASYRVGGNMSKPYFLHGRPTCLHDRLYHRWSKAQKKWIVTRWKRGSITVSGSTWRRPT